MRSLMFLLVLFLPVLAEAEVWHVNDDHSDMGFSVDYLKVSSVSGRFTDVKGTVQFQKGVPVKVELDIKTKSVFTGNKFRDSHLRKPDFLDVKKYPKIRFVSNSVKRLEKNIFEVEGTLKIKDSKKPLMLVVTLSETVKDTWGHKHRFAAYSGQLFRKDFNLNWNKTLPGSQYMVGERVQLKGTIQIQPYGDKTTSSRHMIPDNKTIRKREKVNRGELKPFDLPATTLEQVKPARVLEKLPRSQNKKSDVRDEKEEWPMTKILALIYHGFFGFIGSFAVFFGIKKGAVALFKEKYQETNRFGYLSDAIGFLLCFLWAASFYIFAFES